MVFPGYAPMPSYSTNAQRWAAVINRDGFADTHFFYGVISTGIYCYPSCPSKASLRENTVFFSTRDDALTQGFRACKRCQSDDEPLLVRQAGIVESACRLIESSPDSVKIDDVAKSVNVSRFHLQKLFQRFLAISPKAYAKASRAKDFERALTTSESITRAVYDAGYDSASAFYAEGASRLGMNAKRYKQRGQGMDIRYGFGSSRYGKIVVGITEKGVCSILFGATQKEMLEDLQSRFSNATLSRDADYLEPIVASIVEKINSPESAVNLSLDIQGTAFQEKVWAALQEIPAGVTATYSDVASRIGKPKASRAVASACAANPLAVIVPCHRVVRAGGELSGYRWGIDRKRRLLEDEKDGGNTAE